MMLLSPTIQLTIYLYWAHYPELMRVHGATVFSQSLYMKRFRYFFELYERFYSKSQTNLRKQTKGGTL